MTPEHADQIVSRILRAEYTRESTLAGVQLERDRRRDVRWERAECWLLRGVVAGCAVLIAAAMWRAT